MFEQSNLEESIELWGECFSRSKFGLNEEQVKAFINRLISEREILLERDKHFRSLALKAEKTMLEADSIANEVRRKAEENAQSEAKIIIDQAKEQAKELIGKKREAILDNAHKEAEMIIADASLTAAKHIREAEEEARQKAKAIIMQAMVDGNNLIEQKRNEAKIIALKEVESEKSDILAEAQRRIKEAQEEAEAHAQAQAQAILLSKTLRDDL